MKVNFLFFLILLMSMPMQAESLSKKKLPPCKDTPNCVSSQASDKPHYVEPFKINGDPKLAWQEFRKAIVNHKRMVITHETETSLHAEATSLVLRFVDDIDAFLDQEAGLIHIRSASRIGHSDFGVNRKRIEAIRSKLKAINVLG